MFKLLFTLLPLLFLLAPSADSLNTKDPKTKAASPYTNCGCQCSNLTFRDKYGKTHGNCRSTDHSGAQWCYVDPKQYSSCQDLAYSSARFPGTPWSYEACATPACDNNGGFNSGGFNNGDFNNGGLSNGGFSNGGFNNGGFNNGGLNNGGFNNGGFNNGGLNNGGFNDGGLTNGGFNNGGYNNGGFNNGYNGGTGSSICRGTKCGTGSTGFNTGVGSNGYNNGLAGMLSGRSKTKKAKNGSVQFGR